eukprot:310205_1
MNALSTISTYNQWLIQSKQQLVETSKQNMMKRLSKIIEIVAHKIPSSFPKFKISECNTLRMFKDVKNEIESWKGVDIMSCEKQQKSSFKLYNKTSLNWFNRNKAKIYGNYFFYPLIFIHILKFCLNDLHGMSNGSKIHVFVSILLNILNSKIKFIRTKEQPLLLNQSLIQNNKFKTFFVRFLNQFDNKFNTDGFKIGNVYRKDKERSKKISELFIHALSAIEDMVLLENKKEIVNETKYKNVIYSHNKLLHSTDNTAIITHQLHQNKVNNICKNNERSTSMVSNIQGTCMKNACKHNNIESNTTTYNNQSMIQFYDANTTTLNLATDFSLYVPING